MHDFIFIAILRTVRTFHIILTVLHHLLLFTVEWIIITHIFFFEKKNIVWIPIKHNTLYDI